MAGIGATLFVNQGYGNRLLRAIDITPMLTPDEQQTIGIFERNAPSVVHITSVGLQRSPFSFNVTKVPRGTGTGFIWDEKGHIVTNYHVIENSHQIQVTFQNRKVFDARIVGVAPEKDLAVIRVEAPSKILKPIPIGSSQALKVGQKVYAIGNPFGLDQSLTTGVISALDREIESASGAPISGVVQTDAAINPGNSGGPLLGSGGQLIGVNTAIYSPSGVYAGIGFAIPSDTVNWVVSELIVYGKIARPSLGISLISDRITYQFGLQGAVIYDVQTGGPAATAKLLGTRRDNRGQIILGDIIVGIDKHDIKSSQDLLQILPAFQPNQTVQLRIVRDGQPLTVSVRLATSVDERP